MTVENTMRRPVGAVLHSPLLYDAIVWFALGGREQRLRRRLLDLAGLRAGEVVLDVGCGTGTLAILAKQTVGPLGAVVGVDPSPEMLERARTKASRARVEVRFDDAAARALPFPDSSFDVALSTMMLHHLGSQARGELASGMRRVVKPGGRVLIVDFAKPLSSVRGWSAHIRHRHGGVDLPGIVRLLESAGFDRLESGAVGVKNLHFVRARVPLKTADPVVPR